MMLLKNIVSFFLLCIPVFVDAQQLPVSLDSMNRFFLKLNKDSLFVVNNLEYMIQKNLSTQSLAFKFLTKNSDSVNTLLNYPKGVQMHTEYVIGKEGIDPQLWENGIRSSPISNNPDWKKIKAVIIKRYGNKYSESTLLDAQIRWYEYRNDFPNRIKYTIQKIENNGLDTAGLGRSFLNNMIYDLIFKHSNDTVALGKGLQWAKILIDTELPSANHYDTYANILYKLGRKNEALLWQIKAVAMAPGNADIKNTFDKMKNNLPTWHVNN
jgi:hypothetical protein